MPSLLWRVQRLAARLSNPYASPKHDAKATLPLELVWAIRAHYEEDYDALIGMAGKLDAWRENPAYAKDLRVPSKYKFAYRLMYNLSSTTLRKLSGADAQVGKLPAKLPGGTYVPLSKRTVSSWTVDTDKLNPKASGRLWHLLSVVDLEPNTYIALVEAKVSKRFYLNPDTIPKAVGRNEDMSSEIISVGSVPVVRVFADKVLNGRYDPRPLALKTYNEL